jgi:GNAT superfamily N-acetyltransferase
MGYSINRVEPLHILQLVTICAQHAAFEETSYSSDGKAQALSRALFSHPPRLFGWVAVANGRIIGYATASCEYSTWAASEYLHLDCLYVISGQRNSGIGRALLASVIAFARGCQYAQVQWQTPQWNADARRFYQRLGAMEKTKSRFFLNVGSVNGC